MDILNAELFSEREREREIASVVLKNKIYDLVKGGAGDEGGGFVTDNVMDAFVRGDMLRCDGLDGEHVVT